MTTELSLNEIQKEWHGTLKSYLIGFTLSILLTAASFLLVIYEVFKGSQLVYVLITLGLVQAICQLLFFLHVGQEAKPKWESVIFYFMVLVLFIIAGGSLWIMSDLNDRVMSNMNEESAGK